MNTEPKDSLVLEVAKEQIAKELYDYKVRETVSRLKYIAEMNQKIAVLNKEIEAIDALTEIPNKKVENYYANSTYLNSGINGLCTWSTGLTAGSSLV